MLLNVEFSTLLQEATGEVSVHEIFILLLFLVCTIIFGIIAIAMLKTIITGDKDWYSKPSVSKVNLFARGCLGLLVVAYVIYLLITWGTWDFFTVGNVFIAPPVSAVYLTFGSVLIYMFGYCCLYKPIVAVISFFRKNK